MATEANRTSIHLRDERCSVDSVSLRDLWTIQEL